MNLLLSVLGGFALLLMVMGGKSAKRLLPQLSAGRWIWIGVLTPIAVLFGFLAWLSRFLETGMFTFMLMGARSKPLPKPTHFYDSVQ